VSPDSLAAQAVKLLRSLDVALDRGLTDAELAAIQADFDFRFSAVHRGLLTLAVPIGEGWPDWRHVAPAELRRRLAAPVEGVLFDIEHNGFWPASWGPEPASEGARRDQAVRRAASLPRLIPLYGHRFLPAEPAPDPTPVLSVVQTDVIHYGADLLDYLRREFGGDPGPLPAITARVPFWSELAG
jgi:hypothetical protein